MKKLLLSIFAMLLCVTMYAQELPQLTPPSPTAYQLTKYGDITVNESSGLANINIPLFNFKAGDLSVPINLGYTSSGVKVDQVSTWVGMGWNLSAGGVITRSVRGIADENAQREFIDATTVQNLQNNDLVPGFLNFALEVLDEGIDYEPDIYSFNIGGHSGSFYLNENLVPTFLKKESELKIERTVSTAGFIITTPNGVEYHFDGTGEGSKSESLTGAGHDNPTTLYQTAWFLTKIKNFKGDEIYFKYDYSATYLYTTGFSQMIKTPDDITDPSVGTVDSPPLGSECQESPMSFTTTKYKSRINSRKISEIYTNRSDQKIIFNASKSRSDLPGEHKLNSIELKDGTNLIKKYFLNYDFITSTKPYYGANNVSWLDEADHFKRMFLKNLKETDNTGIETDTKMHSFQYDDASGLPPRMSFSQDLLGYYNGKINWGYLPDNTANILGMYSIAGYSRGDRSADYTYAKKGTLTKVIYPTKGHTILEYEPAIALETTTSAVTSSFNMNVNNLNLDTEFTQDINSLYYQSIRIYPNLTILNGGLDTVHDLANITVRNKTTNALLLDQTIDYNFSNFFDVILEANVIYEVRISLEDVKFDDVQTTLSFTYQSGTTPLSSPINKSGVRIKKLKNKSSDTATEEITRYFYTSKEDLNTTTYNQLYAYSFVENEGERGIGPCAKTVYSFKSTSLNHFYNTAPQSAMYNKVTISKGDNFEGGGIEKHFHLNALATNQVIWGNAIPNQSVTNLQELDNGRLKKEVHFKKNESTITDVMEKEYFYKDVDTFIDAYTGRRRFYSSNQFLIDQIDGADIARYKLFSRNSSIDSTSTKQYFGANTITSTQKYEYTTNLTGLPTEVTTINSKGENLKTKTYYVNDIMYASDLGHDHLTYDEINDINKLKTQYRIGVPVQVESYRNGILHATQRTNYKDLGGGIILPQNIQSSKGLGALEDRIVFHDYYDNGNVKEVSKNGGTHIVYIWGYNETMPIAKIENVTFTELETALGTLHSDYNSLLKIQNLSNADNDRTLNGLGNEGKLRTALEALRVALSSAKTTYFTYDPLIGVTSVTDLRGKTMYYIYDSFNRLQYVKDNEGNILSENQYNYKN